jgi:hypothetical protein
MHNFAIVELEDGLSIVEVKPHETPDAAALREGGSLVDPGPYTSYDDAVDALAELEAEDDDDE